MTDLKAHFALLKELEQENRDVQEQLDLLMTEMERVPPGERLPDEWGPSGTLTLRFIALSERQDEIAAEIKLVSLAIERATPGDDASAPVSKPVN